MTKSTTGLKIGFVLDDGLDNEDGVQAYILALGRWMKQQGHTVHYLVGETRRSDIPNVHSLARNIGVTFNGNKLTIPLPVKGSKIKSFLGEQSYDVLHVQMPYSPLFGAKVVSRAPPETAVVGTFHILPYGFLARIGTKLLGLVLTRSLKRFDDYVSVSSAARIFAKTSFNISTDVVPNVVDVSFFKPKTKQVRSDIFSILFLGRLVERKGCAYLIDALKHLTKRYPDLHFHLNICGKGPLDGALRAKVEEHGLSEKVTFLGFVSNEEKARYMQQADIAVFPSYAGESFGIVLAEAMAAESGVVLGGNNPGYASVLGDIPETLIDVKNVASVSDTLGRFMQDKKLFASVHARQQQLVGKFDVEFVGKELLGRYQNCKNKRLGR